MNDPKSSHNPINDVLENDYRSIDAICPICGRDLSTYNSVRRGQHINRCLDQGTESIDQKLNQKPPDRFDIDSHQKPTLKLRKKPTISKSTFSANNASSASSNLDHDQLEPPPSKVDMLEQKYDCVVCSKSLSSFPFAKRLNHVRSCASKNGISADDMEKLKQEAQDKLDLKNEVWKKNFGASSKPIETDNTTLINSKPDKPDKSKVTKKKKSDHIEIKHHEKVLEPFYPQSMIDKSLASDSSHDGKNTLLLTPLSATSGEPSISADDFQLFEPKQQISAIRFSQSIISSTPQIEDSNLQKVYQKSQQTYPYLSGAQKHVTLNAEDFEEEIVFKRKKRKHFEEDQQALTTLGIKEKSETYSVNKKIKVNEFKSGDSEMDEIEFDEETKEEQKSSLFFGTSNKEHTKHQIGTFDVISDCTSVSPETGEPPLKISSIQLSELPNLLGTNSVFAQKTNTSNNDYSESILADLGISEDENDDENDFTNFKQTKQKFNDKPSILGPSLPKPANMNNLDSIDISESDEYSQSSQIRSVLEKNQSAQTASKSNLSMVNSVLQQLSSYQSDDDQEDNIKLTQDSTSTDDVLKPIKDLPFSQNPKTSMTIKQVREPVALSKPEISQKIADMDDDDDNDNDDNSLDLEDDVVHSDDENEPFIKKEEIEFRKRPILSVEDFVDLTSPVRLPVPDYLKRAPIQQNESSLKSEETSETISTRLDFGDSVVPEKPSKVNQRQSDKRATITTSKAASSSFVNIQSNSKPNSQNDTQTENSSKFETEIDRIFKRYFESKQKAEDEYYAQIGRLTVQKDKQIMEICQKFGMEHNKAREREYWHQIRYADDQKSSLLMDVQQDSPIVTTVELMPKHVNSESQNSQQQPSSSSALKPAALLFQAQYLSSNSQQQPSNEQSNVQATNHLSEQRSSTSLPKASTSTTLISTSTGQSTSNPTNRVPSKPRVKPNFQDMSNYDIRALADKFGLRSALSRPILIQQLDSIWEYQNSLLEEQENQIVQQNAESSSRNSRTTSTTNIASIPSTSTITRNNGNQVGQVVQNVRRTQLGKKTSSQSETNAGGVYEPPMELDQKIDQFIKGDADLYSSILHFTTVDLVELQNKLKNAKIKCNRQFLQDYLHSRSINFVNKKTARSVTKK